MKGWKETVRRKFRKRDAEDIISAIEADKYWKASPDGRYIFVLALTRARTRLRGEYWARCTALGRVKVSPEVRRFVKRYMVMLVDREEGLALKVLTWNAFRKVMRANMGPDMLPSFLRRAEHLKKEKA